MNNTTEILTKIYGYVNRIKLCLTFKDIAKAWIAVNELSDYLISIDVEDHHLSNQNSKTEF